MPATPHCQNVGVGSDKCGGAEVLKKDGGGGGRGKGGSSDYTDGSFRNQLAYFQICKCDDVTIANSVSVNPFVLNAPFLCFLSKES